MRKSKLQKKPAPMKYKYIYAWGRYLDSKDYYIQDQQRKAEEENAPLNAIYRLSDGTWQTMDSISDANLAAALKDYVKYIP